MRQAYDAAMRELILICSEHPELAALWLNFRLETMKPLRTFYGDDFTGSTAVMEVLSFAGVSTMLFLEPPELEVLKD